MDNLLKYLMFIFIAMALASCGDDDKDSPNEPEIPNLSSNVAVKYVKKSNCPFATMPVYAVYENEIYFINGVSFAKYSPNSDNWTELKPLPSYSASLFVFQNRLFSVNMSEGVLLIYDKATDTWSDAISFLGSTIPYAGYAVVDNKLYAHRHLNDQVYDSTSKSWNRIPLGPPTNTSNIFDFNNECYFIRDQSIMRYSCESNTEEKKLNLETKYLYVCAFNNSSMLGMSNSLFGDYVHLLLCIYTPLTNDIKTCIFTNDPNYKNHTEKIEYADIPILSDKIVNVGGRFFVGPDNSKFYEIQFKLK